MHIVPEGTILAAGSTVCFRVNGGPLGNGITWSLKTKSSSGDVYGAWHASRRTHHFSFHESGQTHYAVDGKLRHRLPAGVPTHSAIRPISHAVSPGVWFAKRIAVPYSELSPDWSESTPSNVIEVPLAPGLDGVGLDFYMLDEGFTSVEFSQAHPVAFMSRGDGGCVAVVATPLSLDAPVHVALAVPIRKHRRRLQELRVTFPTKDVLIAEDPESPHLQRDVEILFR